MSTITNNFSSIANKFHHLEEVNSKLNTLTTAQQQKWGNENRGGTTKLVNQLIQEVLKERPSAKELAEFQKKIQSHNHTFQVYDLNHVLSVIRLIFPSLARNQQSEMDTKHTQASKSLQEKARDEDYVFVDSNGEEVAVKSANQSVSKAVSESLDKMNESSHVVRPQAALKVFQATDRMRKYLLEQFAIIAKSFACGCANRGWDDEEDCRYSKCLVGDTTPELVHLFSRYVNDEPLRGLQFFRVLHSEGCATDQLLIKSVQHFCTTETYRDFFGSSVRVEGNIPKEILSFLVEALFSLKRPISLKQFPEISWIFEQCFPQEIIFNPEYQHILKDHRSFFPKLMERYSQAIRLITQIENYIATDINALSRLLSVTHPALGHLVNDLIITGDCNKVRLTDEWKRSLRLKVCEWVLRSEIESHPQFLNVTLDELEYHKTRFLSETDFVIIKHEDHYLLLNFESNESEIVLTGYNTLRPSPEHLAYYEYLTTLIPSEEAMKIDPVLPGRKILPTSISKALKNHKKPPLGDLRVYPLSFIPYIRRRVMSESDHYMDTARCIQLKMWYEDLLLT